MRPADLVLSHSRAPFFYACKWKVRTCAFFEANGIECIGSLVTDNGSAYRSTAFNDAVSDFVGRHQCTQPYTPRHNGKVERYNRILAEKFLYARPFIGEEQRRNALGQWLAHYNFRRPHTATAGNPPASRVPTPENNATPSYN